MKQIATIFLLFFAAIFYSSCGSDSNDSSGGLLGPGGSNSISFTISGQGDPTNYTFSATPSVDTKITRVIASAPAFNFADTIVIADPTQTFTGGTAYALDPYTGVEAGQAWVFTFTGTVISNNEAYTVSTNYTVPN